MIYANAELNGIPWETIIKCYRSERTSLGFPYLADYVKDLENYIRANSDMFSEESEVYSIANGAYNALLPILDILRRIREVALGALEG